jgi:hypothetical protein
VLARREPFSSAVVAPMRCPFRKIWMVLKASAVPRIVGATAFVMASVCEMPVSVSAVRPVITGTGGRTPS